MKAQLGELRRKVSVVAYQVEVRDEADPQSGGSVGAAGNARLTSVTGLVLLVMLAVEGYTILDVQRFITLHVFLGVMLVAPVLLKSGSTLYRFMRYYSGAEAYVRKGPPHPVLRIIGPLVILSSLTVLGSGLGLLAVNPGQRGILLTLHQASFIVWVGLMTIHVLGHLRGAAIDCWRELRSGRRDPVSRRRAVRLTAVALALAVGIAGAILVTPAASAWTDRGHHVHNLRR
jgi:hypothetical protein